ncbi:bZIP transcription factor [Sodiomyces alkalinus F11]|uniref:BZIP transcription factor n=1 Tax=Sodiomyces alkalinus (strain CBS 110278 / VKM F-3762 / F11) TaxID=1314773 RepID=A0A3N2PQS9_SODAK|nr:bZIP transcription factor [Sodiomyces alkalinus F11]ROT36867.1 bZIP transcription factor [Sodiomyces alkalinus F11]
MVPAFQMQPYYRATSLSVDTHHAQKYFEEEDNSVLDENILEHSAVDSGLEMSPPMANSRRDSFAVGSSLFSPKTEDWHSVDMQSIPSNNPFIGNQSQQHSNNPFFRLDRPDPSPFGPPSNAWSLGNGSGSCTPLPQFDGLPAEFDAAASLFPQQPMQSHTPITPFGNPSGQVNLFSSLGSATQPIPPSPQKAWIGQNESMAKKMRPNTPSIRSHNELRRGDGIRKKNARFDIPAERNLNNIDQLIAQSTDEQEIKELKQQKRLLRNRQAALDSRQRKKQHTERLEDEKKHFTAVLGEMEEEMADLKEKMEQLLREKQSYQEYVETLTLEKEEMIRSHTIETGELRKKVGVLTDHVQRLESSAMSAGAPAAHGFPSVFDDMDGMTMTGLSAPWDNAGLFGEYPDEPEEVKQQELQVVPAKKTEIHFPAEVEKPATQGGILFMLFLVGAFVLSNRSASAPSIPRVSEDVRAEAATLLESVFKDAGVGEASTTIQGGMAPQPSGMAWTSNPTLSTSAGGSANGNVNVVEPSMLSQLGDSLIQPSQEQTNEQIFGLSAAQYNGVTSQDFLQNPPERSTSQGRRNLAEALAGMRNNNKQSAAEVYTRSLLWDQIPSEVVKNFARMIAECNNADQNEQRQQECMEA